MKHQKVIRLKQKCLEGLALRRKEILNPNKTWLSNHLTFKPKISIQVNCLKNNLKISKLAKGVAEMGNEMIAVVSVATKNLTRTEEQKVMVQIIKTFRPLKPTGMSHYQAYEKMVEV